MIIEAAHVHTWAMEMIEIVKMLARKTPILEIGWVYMQPQKTASSLTSRTLRALAGDYVIELGKKVKTNPKLVLQLWPEIIGSHMAAMTKAIKFENGSLFVLVNNSTLLSLLHRKEEKRLLLEAFKNKAPGVTISDIIFRLG